YPVVIGARSATFAPQPDLGLIVVDEEHEWTYKQHDAEPRYHARDAVLRLAQLSGATVLLGSATPDVVSYAPAKARHYRLLGMPGRVGSSRPPSIQIVDLAAELREGNHGIFSRALAGALAETLGRGEQAMLFLNRRGSASFLLCRDCGHVPHCSGCQVPLTVHTAGERLRCHLCNRGRRIPPACPACGGPRVRPFRPGTQPAEAGVRAA